ncbi:MAG: UDP-2,3-diacylglucosamine diphosphatase LpxI [Desulfobulbaceae bacterium]|nr:UDP-2,3-diacylglucosamine diphosphatase LpxI [Desulfobulbaceae bacterium]
MNSKIGIIAGGGQFPLLFAKAAREQGRQVIVVAHEGETNPDIEAVADRLFWVKLGQLGKIIKHFKSEGVTETVLVGTITKTRIFRDIMPDLKGLSLWNKIDARQDDAILRAIAGELEKDGIKVLESTLYLQHLLFPQGNISKKKPSAEQREDISFGWQMARSVGALDIGQCVIVRDRTVLAVEAIEGTDATIKRGGSLGRENAVVVKVKKPGQDFRFDLPAIGVTTLDSMQEAKAKVLAVEAGQALLFDREAFVKAANRAGIIVVGVEELADGKLAM